MVVKTVRQQSFHATRRFPYLTSMEGLYFLPNWNTLWEDLPDITLGWVFKLKMEMSGAKHARERIDFVGALIEVSLDPEIKQGPNMRYGWLGLWVLRGESRAMSRFALLWHHPWCHKSPRSFMLFHQCTFSTPGIKRKWSPFPTHTYKCTPTNKSFMAQSYNGVQ